MSDSVPGRASAGAVSWVTATAIVIADMVGVGVFTSLGFQVSAISSGFALLLLWIVGGVVALCGAACYAELAGMFPRSSGEYNFLRQMYHPAFGFVAGMLSATVGFAAPIALAAMAFGSYFKSIVPDAPPLLLGFGVTWLAALVHLGGVRLGAAYHNVWTALKLLLIFAFIVAGVAGVMLGHAQPISFAPSAADLGIVTSEPFAVSLVFVMYSYSGWNAATYIFNEIREPAHNVRRALFVGTAVVVVLYVGLNAVFLSGAPLSELAGQLDVGLIAGRHIFGEAGGRVVAAFICIGLISSISAMMWVGPRVTMVMGEDVLLLKAFSKKARNGVPVTALLFQLALVTALMLTQSFEAVLDFIQFALTFCSFLTVFGVIVLRYRQPDLPRPYKAWGYPVTPFIFLAVTLLVLAHLATERPLQSLASFCTMLAGLLVYGMSVRHRRGASQGND